MSIDVQNQNQNIFFDNYNINPKLVSLVNSVLSHNDLAKEYILNEFTNKVQKLYFKSFIKWIKPKYIKSIYLSPNYVVFRIERKIKMSKWYHDDFNIIGYLILVGINDDGKYFVNRLFGRSLMFFDKDKSPCLEYKGIKIYIVDDDCVYDSLQYHYDIVNHNVNEIKREPIWNNQLDQATLINYRMQGDLVMVTADKSTYFDNIKSNLTSVIDRDLTNYILNVITQILRKYRFNCEINHSEVLVNAIPKWLNVDKANNLIEKLEKVVMNELAKHFQKFGKVHFEYLDGKIPCLIFDELNKSIMFSFHLDYHAGFGLSYRNIIISIRLIDPMIINYYVDKVYDDIVNQLEFNQYEINVNNHKIHFEKAYPNMITFSYKLFDQEITSSVTLGWILVDKDSKIFLIHDEHKPVIVKTSDTISIALSHISVNDDPGKLNYLALKAL